MLRTGSSLLFLADERGPHVDQAELPHKSGNCVCINCLLGHSTGESGYTSTPHMAYSVGLQMHARTAMEVAYTFFNHGSICCYLDATGGRVLNWPEITGKREYLNTVMVFI